MEKPQASSIDRLELVRWLIQRYDDQREAIANRAAIVLSADTILVAASTLLLDKALSNKSIFDMQERAILMALIAITIICLGISIYFSTTSIANVWKTSRDLAGADIPRMFFYPRDTIGHTKNFGSFKESFISVSEEQLLLNALGELWSGMNAHSSRYQKLRLAIKWVIISFIPLFLTLGIFLFKIL